MMIAVAIGEFLFLLCFAFGGDMFPGSPGLCHGMRLAARAAVALLTLAIVVSLIPTR